MAINRLNDRLVTEQPNPVLGLVRILLFATVTSILGALVVAVAVLITAD